jgi:hypothetical protein
MPRVRIRSYALARRPLREARHVAVPELVHLEHAQVLVAVVAVFVVAAA